MVSSSWRGGFPHLQATHLEERWKPRFFFMPTLSLPCTSILVSWGLDLPQKVKWWLMHPVVRSFCCIFSPHSHVLSFSFFMMGWSSWSLSCSYGGMLENQNYFGAYSFISLQLHACEWWYVSFHKIEWQSMPPLCIIFMVVFLHHILLCLHSSLFRHLASIVSSLYMGVFLSETMNLPKRVKLWLMPPLAIHFVIVLPHTLMCFYLPMSPWGVHPHVLATHPKERWKPQSIENIYCFWLYIYIWSKLD